MILSICLPRTETSRFKTRPITDIQVWTDAIIAFASLYVRAHPEASISLFKLLHVMRLGASRVSGLGWRDYNIQFRLKN